MPITNPLINSEQIALITKVDTKAQMGQDMLLCNEFAAIYISTGADPDCDGWAWIANNNPVAFFKALIVAMENT